MKEKRRAVFIDKDGTLIHDIPFNADVSKIRFSPGAFPALRRLSRQGYDLIVVTNQPGLAQGKFSTNDLLRVKEFLENALRNEGLTLKGFFYCPHDPSDHCDCRKPEPGLIFKAAAETDISLENSWFIGDILDDVEAATRAGVRSVLLNNGNETEWKLSSESRKPDYLAGSLDEAAESIIHGESEPLTALPRNYEEYSADFGLWQKAKRILAIRLDAMGDVIMTSPALRALKTARADRSITLLTSPSGASVTPLMPFIDETLVAEVPWMKPASVETAGRDSLRALAAEVEKRHFDAAVIFTVYSQSALPAALLCLIAGIPLRLAYSRENPYRLLSEWVKEREPLELLRHEVTRQLALVRRVGAAVPETRLPLSVPPSAEEEAQKVLSRRGVLPSDVVIVIHPGASAPSRRYEPARYGTVAEMLLEAGYRVALTGSSSERALIAEVVSSISPEFRPRAVRLEGEISIVLLAALLKRASLIVTNNSGPAHLAAAVGTPVVDLYALTNPQHTPWGVPSRVLFQDVPCKFCYRSICPEKHHRCLHEVSPQRVLKACLHLLSDHTQGSGFIPGTPLVSSTPW